MTSNIGSDLIMEKLGSKNTEEKVTQEELRKIVESRLYDYFRPEFINRLDDIIIFKPIDQDMLRKIVDIQLIGVIHMLEKEKNIKLFISDKAKDFLAKKWRDPQFGARPLKRAIQNYLIDELAMQIIEGKIKEGKSVRVEVEDEKIVVKKS